MLQKNIYKRAILQKQWEISFNHKGGLYGDALVTVSDGKGKFIVDGKEYILNTGESLVMPARKPHSVHAIEGFKMQLTVVFPLER